MHGAMHDQSISVDLTTNCITIGATEIKLTPQQSELALVLLKAMPGGARKAAIILALWGNFERENPDAHIKVLASYLRRKLAPHGISIDCVHSIGYRMVRGEVAKDTRSTAIRNGVWSGMTATLSDTPADEVTEAVRHAA